jgi:hypothetical protein
LPLDVALKNAVPVVLIMQFGRVLDEIGSHESEQSFVGMHKALFAAGWQGHRFVNTFLKPV